MTGSIVRESGRLFIWSDRAEELSRAAATWRVVESADPAGVAARLWESGARLAVVDARARPAQALHATAAMKGAAGALLVLVPGDRSALLDELLDAGATHFLADPWTPGEFAAALRFAARHAGRPAPATSDPLADSLAGAIERGEVDVLFQPQVALATGAIVGVEALARWEHPLLGVLGAEPLFAAAGRAGLSVPLSDHVQAMALQRAAAWPRSLDPLRLSMNVTAADLSCADFTTRFLDRVRASGVAIRRVTAEITETELVTDLEPAAGRLAGLRAAGCRVAIDDFGTGYSSLAYLKALPLDYLKIDKALTGDVTGSGRDRVIVRAVIAMARALGLTVIAEGVETAAQRDLLAADGCELYQGFLCAEPLDSAALARLLEGGRWSG